MSHTDSSEERNRSAEKRRSPETRKICGGLRIRRKVCARSHAAGHSGLDRPLFTCHLGKGFFHCAMGSAPRAEAVPAGAARKDLSILVAMPAIWGVGTEHMAKRMPFVKGTVKI